MRPPEKEVANRADAVKPIYSRARVQVAIYSAFI